MLAVDTEYLLAGLLATLPLLTHGGKIVGRPRDPHVREQILLDYFAKGLRAWPGEPTGVDDELDHLLVALPAWVNAVNEHPDLFLKPRRTPGGANGGR